MDKKIMGFPPESYSTSYNLRNEIKQVLVLSSYKAGWYHSLVVIATVESLVLNLT